MACLRGGPALCVIAAQAFLIGTRLTEAGIMFSNSTSLSL
jgi:hypothetical protein